jgi:hypothetical protein
VPLCTDFAMMPDMEHPLFGFAVCGQNIRKVKRKVYGPGDLVSTESQTDETVDQFFQFQSLPPPQTLVLDK